MNTPSDSVTYEMFGAVGDGIADDLAAIQKAHEHANANGLSIRTKPEGTYHLGCTARTVFIETDTDWNTSRFTIDDTAVEDHKAPLFHVRSALLPETISISSLTRDQKQLDARPGADCYVWVENRNELLYRRRGLNQSKGSPQQDCFILRRDGSVEGDIDWNYDEVTKLDVRPIDDSVLTVRGGVFTTFANRMNKEGYNYWGRNIEITRSNTVIEKLTHYVVGETSIGQPYRGFISANQCANITFRDCFVTPHKIYSTIGSVGMPVNMGSYDLHANSIVNLQVINCRMNLVCDRTRWGVFATNFCKNILLDGCDFSRMDTHMGVSGTYTIRNCTLGHMGLNAIGRGVLTLENTTHYGPHLVAFRGDYGSTWEGEVFVRDCRWIPACGDVGWPMMLGMNNDGTHDFGYPCSMPSEVSVDGLFVDDSNHPADYTGMYLFADPQANESEPAKERPHPYKTCQKITIRGLETASGMPIAISPNTELVQQVALVWS